MSSPRNNFGAVALTSLLQLAVIVYQVVGHVSDRGRTLLRRILRWLEGLEEGHILPLYANQGHSNYKFKKD